MARKFYVYPIMACALTFVGAAHTALAFDHHALATAAVNGHIRPGYTRLLQAMQTLEGSVSQLCQSPSVENLKTAQLSFRAAVTARGAIEHLRFDPVARHNRYERLAFWPDPKGIGRKQIRRALRRKKPGLDDPAALVKMSVALQGLTALEVVLFDKSSWSLQTATPDGHFRCSVAWAISKNLTSIASDIKSEWLSDKGFGQIILTPGPGNPVYLSAQEVTLELAQAYTAGLVFVRDRKIENPVGDEHGSRPSSVEYRVSASGRHALKGNIQGLADFYRNGGLRNALGKISHERVKRADENFKLATEMLAAVSLPLVEAVDNEADIDRLITLSLSLSGARSAVGKGINQAAGLSLGFNAGDGD